MVINVLRGVQVGSDTAASSARVSSEQLFEHQTPLNLQPADSHDLGSLLNINDDPGAHRDLLEYANLPLVLVISC